MPVRELVQTITERLGGTAGVKSVYGDAVTTGNRTVIPVAKVSYGFGVGTGKRPAGGAGDEGGGAGGGVRVVPAGVFEITPEGSRFVRADMLRPLAASVLAGFAAGFLIGRFRR